MFLSVIKITPRLTKKKKHGVKGLDMMTTVTQLMSEKYFSMKMKVLSCMQFMQNSGRIKLSMKLFFSIYKKEGFVLFLSLNM